MQAHAVAKQRRPRPGWLVAAAARLHAASGGNIAACTCCFARFAPDGACRCRVAAGPKLAGFAAGALQLRSRCRGGHNRPRTGTASRPCRPSCCRHSWVCCCRCGAARTRACGVAGSGCVLGSCFCCPGCRCLGCMCCRCLCSSRWSCSPLLCWLVALLCWHGRCSSSCRRRLLLQLLLGLLLLLLPNFTASCSWCCGLLPHGCCTAILLILGRSICRQASTCDSCPCSFGCQCCFGCGRYSIGSCRDCMGLVGSRACLLLPGAWWRCRRECCLCGLQVQGE